MEKSNITRITVIHLIGFQTSEVIKLFIFFLFFGIYFVTICGNLLIIALVSYSKSLHSPMYFFVSQLSVSDIFLTTVILPNILYVVLVTETIALSYCITQFYFFGVSEFFECILLTVMSYDRYLAICRPLHYHLIMSHQICWIMTITSWTLSFLILLVQILNITNLQFCGPNVVDHFYCDLDPILELSCSDTTIVELGSTILSAVFGIIPSFIVFLSYVYIIVTIFKIPSVTGRKKVFSTCSSHLIVVSIYYGTLFCIYLVPRRRQSWNISKFLSLLYTVVTPLLNPIIYSLRNKDLKILIGKFINNFVKLHFSRD